MTEVRLRDWQTMAVKKALDWYKNNESPFLINAAPGAGKTICSVVLANNLIKMNEVERVVVIAPRTEVVRQWARDFKSITGRYMMKISGASDDDEFNSLDVDLCATWAAIKNITEPLQNLCLKKKVMVICDEHHHAAIKAAWGEGAEAAFKDCKYSLVLTGTPIRSDGEQTTWFAYDEKGRIDHPEEGTYTLSYGQAVDLNYCRPVSFHRHEGNFRVKLSENEELRISGVSGIENPEVAPVKAIQKALDYYVLACTPIFEKDGITPDVHSFQGTMLSYGISKLDDLRLRVPNAGGIVIAPNTDVADHMAKILEMLDDEKPTVVHTKEKNIEEKINAFRNTKKRWIVSVGMISEGVDIQRLRVMVYLPTARTELHFRQAVGRVVRSMGDDDFSRAYVIMPTHKMFEHFAKKIELEMSPAVRKENSSEIRDKVCGECGEINDISSVNCSFCDAEFPKRKGKTQECRFCGTSNPQAELNCINCGESLSLNYSVELDDAFRMGAIVRGMELDEDLVLEGEGMADEVRESIFREGDAPLVKFLKSFPEESFAKFRRIIADE